MTIDIFCRDTPFLSTTNRCVLFSFDFFAYIRIYFD